MVDKKTVETRYKIIIVLTFLISLICLSILMYNNYNPDKYGYETKIIQLNNTNAGVYDNVVDYICDEGIYIYNDPLSNYLYFSTWESDPSVKERYKGMNGRCMIKIKYLR